MHILRKRFSEAGLCDVLIQSGTIAERSIDKADKVIEMTLNKDTKIPVNHDVFKKVMKRILRLYLSVV